MEKPGRNHPQYAAWYRARRRLGLCVKPRTLKTADQKKYMREYMREYRRTNGKAR